MSRSYNMNVTVGELVGDEAQTIDEVLEMECGAEEAGFVFDKQYNCNFDMNLCGGETEDQFADRISASIWKALKHFYPICVTATCLENLPVEEYPMDEEDFKRLTA